MTYRLESVLADDDSVVRARLGWDTEIVGLVAGNAGPLGGGGHWYLDTAAHFAVHLAVLEK